MARRRPSDKGGRWKAPTSKKARRAMPASAFLKDGTQRKYPYKVYRGGKWIPSERGLVAAYKRAAQQGDKAVMAKAKRIADPIRKRKGKPPLGASRRKKKR